MFKNTAVKMIVALSVLGILSGLILVCVYNYSMPKITANLAAETDRAIKNIFPGASQIIKRNKLNDVYKALDAKGRILGYAFLAKGNGYQGVIKIIAGVDPAVSSMLGMEVLDSQETPGLGAEIANPNFRKQFQGLSLKHAIEYVKNRTPQEPYEIEAITGATISSRAIVNILNKRIKKLREEIK